MVNNTGTKPLKSTGNKKLKVSVCLTTKAEGTKLKPFIAFQGAKHKETALNEEFKNRHVVASSSNGRMNEQLFLRFFRQVLGTFSFEKLLFAWAPLRPT